MGKKSLIVILLSAFSYICAGTFVVPPGGYIASAKQRSIKNRLSSAPYISGDTFRSFCDFALDEVRQPFKLDQLKPGDALFLNANYARLFFKSVHPHITVPYILVTHNSIHSMPGRFKKYLESPHLAAWFAQNADCTHEKIYPIPVGIANRYWPHGNIECFSTMLDDSDSDRPHLVYVNFESKTNKKARAPVAQHFKKAHYAYRSGRKKFKPYLKDLKRSKFVVSPLGNGIDCHRTWEALYMGAIPIVESSTINKLYEDLPVVVVDDWSIVTQQFLVKEYERISNTFYSNEKIFATYWKNLIQETKERIRSAYQNKERGSFLAAFPADFDTSMRYGGKYRTKEADRNSAWKAARKRYNDFLCSGQAVCCNPIPRTIHHIWIGKPMPEREQELVATWRMLHPTWKHMLWDDEAIEAFNLVNKEAYDRAKNFGEKSDIARYEILYRHGGIYADTDFECLRSFDAIVDASDFFAGLAFESSRFSVFNGLIGSAPGHPILKRCIEGLRKRAFSSDSLANTGPHYFGSCIAQELSNTDITTVLFPVTYFYPWPHYMRHQRSREGIEKWFCSESYAVHHWHVSWRR